MYIYDVKGEGKTSDPHNQASGGYAMSMQTVTIEHVESEPLRPLDTHGRGGRKNQKLFMGRFFHNFVDFQKVVAIAGNANYNFYEPEVVRSCRVPTVGFLPLGYVSAWVCSLVAGCAAMK